MAKNYRQFRISIPDDDPASIAWCQKQNRELSLAIRILIQDKIKKDGEIRNMFATNVNDEAKPAKKQLKKEKTAPKAKPVNNQTDSANDMTAALKNMMM